MFAQIVSVTALAVSITTFSLSYRSFRAAERRSRMPILVFTYTDDDGWTLRNVGYGPALNIVVCHQHETGDQAEQWYAPVRVPPLARDGAFSLPWLTTDWLGSLGARYEDFQESDERLYTTVCRHDLNTVSRLRLMPEWPEAAIRRHWELNRETFR